MTFKARVGVEVGSVFMAIVGTGPSAYRIK